METNKTGEIIKKLRKEHKLTQEQLGSILGVQKSAIAKYERGEIVNLKRETIEKLAEAFDVMPSYIMGISDSPTHSISLSPHEIALIKSYRTSPISTRPPFTWPSTRFAVRPQPGASASPAPRSWD